MNSVVHFEMPYDDQARMTKFYEQAFGWQTKALGEEMGVQSLVSTLRTARNAFPTADLALGAAARVDRQDARELIRTLLLDLAGADGTRSEAEQALIERVDALWRPG